MSSTSRTLARPIPRQSQSQCQRRRCVVIWSSLLSRSSLRLHPCSQRSHSTCTGIQSCTGAAKHFLLHSSCIMFLPCCDDDGSGSLRAPNTVRNPHLDHHAHAHAASQLLAAGCSPQHHRATKRVAAPRRSTVASSATAATRLAPYTRSLGLPRRCSIELASATSRSCTTATRSKLHTRSATSRAVVLSSAHQRRPEALHQRRARQQHHSGAVHVLSKPPAHPRHPAVQHRR